MGSHRVGHDWSDLAAAKGYCYWVPQDLPHIPAFSKLFVISYMTVPQGILWHNAGILCLKWPSWVKAKVFDSQSEFIAHESLLHLLAQQSPVRQAIFLLFVPIVKMSKLSPRDCTVPGSGTVRTRVQFVQDESKFNSPFIQHTFLILKKNKYETFNSPKIVD